MISLKLYIKHCSDSDFIRNRINAFTYAFRLMYKKTELLSDANFEKYIENKFSLKQMEYRSIKQQVYELKEQEETNRADKIERIKDLQDEIKKEESKDKVNLSKRFKLYRKKQRLEDTANINTTFGGRALLQGITRASNNNNTGLYQKYLSEYRENRKRSVYLMGESNQKGNRFFCFDRLSEGIVEYRPFKGKKIEFLFNSKRYDNTLLNKISELTELKILSVSVTFNNDSIILTYDNELLNGYSIDEKGRRLEVVEIKSHGHSKDMESGLIKECYRKYYEQQKAHKLEGKIKGRVAAVDLNPDNIGFSILDTDNNGGYRVKFAALFDLGKLNKKLHKKSTDNKQKYQNNKRRYEITIIWKQIFNIVKNYGCSEFIMEDLSFKTDSNLNREANRKTRNLWHRELTQHLIEKYCLNNGIELKKVNAVYSSFIGNIQHDYVDAVNASIEIGRRGMYKYVKDKFYPHIEAKDYDTMERKFQGYLVDAHSMTDLDWVKIYKSLTDLVDDRAEFARRLRAAFCDLDNYRMFSIKNRQSRVYKYVFKVA